VRRLGTARARLTTILHGAREVDERAAPVDAAVAVAQQRHRLVVVAVEVGRDLQPRVELGPAREPQHPAVAVELEPAVDPGPDVERRGQAHDEPRLELHDGDREIRSVGAEGCAVERDALRLERRRVRRHAPRRAEDRGQQRERVDADVDHRPDRVERRRRRVPRLDPAPVRLGIRDANVPDRLLAQELPRRLLRVSEQRRRRRAQAKAARRGEVDELARLVVAQRERLLAVDVLAGLERRGGDLRVSGGRRQVDDRVDALVREQCVQRRARNPAELRRELIRAPRDSVGRRHQLELLELGDPCGVPLRDVPAADDAEPQTHCRSCASIAAQSSLGS
jgi:hypothetical protein